MAGEWTFVSADVVDSESDGGEISPVPVEGSSDAVISLLTLLSSDPVTVTQHSHTNNDCDDKTSK
jgi:hypothetical protein